jgi:hypothetical protein
MIVKLNVYDVSRVKCQNDKQLLAIIIWSALSLMHDVKSIYTLDDVHVDKALYHVHHFNE